MKNKATVQVENDGGPYGPPSLARLAITSIHVPADDQLASFAVNHRNDGAGPDLSQDQTCRSLLKALNEWRCRLATDLPSVESQVEALKTWFRECQILLPQPDSLITSLTNAELQKANEAYVNLRDREVGWPNGHRSFAPIAAAKTLFALRPKALMPWDGKIRETLHCARDEQNDYREFLLHVQRVLAALDAECRIHGFDLDKLPGRLDHPDVPLTRLVDLYYYSTITLRERLPTRRQVEEWCKWGLQ